MATSTSWVVGAGIVGMTTALLLQRAGRRVTVVTAKDVSQSVTTHSTVKVTVGHSTLHSEIEDKRGFDAAKVYAQANVAGFESILELVRTLDIDCMLEHGHPHVVHAEKPEERDKVEREADAVARIGLAGTLSGDAPLPFDVDVALRFENQAHFTRRGTWRGSRRRSSARAGRSSREFRRSMSTGGPTSATCRRRRGRCRRSTSSWRPRSRSSTAAASSHVEADAFLRHRGRPPRCGLRWHDDQRRVAAHSTRSTKLGGEELLIVVGEGHEVGHVTDTAQRWTRLRQWAHERFGVSDFR